MKPDNMITKYQAEHDKKWIHDSDELITLKDKLKAIINDNWFYSMHWKEDTWVEQAKKDCKDKMDANREEYISLSVARDLLNQIEE